MVYQTEDIFDGKTNTEMSILVGLFICLVGFFTSYVDE